MLVGTEKKWNTLPVHLKNRNLTLTTFMTAQDVLDEVKDKHIDPQVLFVACVLPLTIEGHETEHVSVCCVICRNS